MENEQIVNKKKWYQTSAGIIALLILFFPAGLYLMWKYADWNRKAKWIVTGGVVILFLISSAQNSSKNTQPGQSNQQAVQSTKAPQQEVTQPTKTTEVITPAPTKVTVKATNTPAPIQTKQSAPVSGVTVSQKNALKSAKSYLNYSAFSHDGLIAQLEYEKFSHDDAVYGADNSGANWNEQAAKSAKSYMNYSAFSRGSLIDQLKYDKFTQEQAEYGATAVGL